MLLRLRAESSRPQGEQSERGSLDRPEVTVPSPRDVPRWYDEERTPAGVEETREGRESPGLSWVPSTLTGSIRKKDEVEAETEVMPNVNGRN